MRAPLSHLSPGVTAAPPATFDMGVVGVVLKLLPEEEKPRSKRKPKLVLRMD